jgi:ribosomal protein S12
MNAQFQTFPQQARGPAGFMDLSHANLPSAMPQTAGEAGIQIQFFYASVQLSNADPAFDKKVVTRLCIKKRPVSDRKTTSVEFISEEQAMREYPREFAMFQEYGEVPMEGTPLQDVPGISRADVSRLNAMGLRSAEDVASLSEDMAAQNGRDMLRAWKVITAWVKVNADSSAMVQMAERDAARDAEMKVLRESMEEMAKQNEALMAKIEAMQSVSGQYAPAQAVQNPQAMTMPAGGQQSQSWNAEDTDGLPSSLADMPNPWAEGSDTGEASIEENDDDPLKDEPEPNRAGIVE